MAKAKPERPLKAEALTVRLISEDLERLRKLAEELGVGPAVLARILIRQGLKSLSSSSESGVPPRLPLKELSELLAPMAQARGLSEEELLEEVKAIRRELYGERYAPLREQPSQSQS